MFQTAVGQSAGRDSEREAVVVADLKKIAPGSAAAFTSATEALDAGDNQKAAELFAQVLKAAPDFEPALRRRGGALVSLGQRDEGLILLERAVELNRSAENLAALSYSVFETSSVNREPTPGEISRALALAQEALGADKSGDAYYRLNVAELALAANDSKAFDSIVNLLEARYPDHFGTRYFKGIKLANQGEFDGAIAELEKSREFGAPPEAVDNVIQAIKAERGKQFFGLYDYIWYGVYIVAVWAVGLLGLFIAGKLLSATTLASIEKSDPNDISGQAQAGLRGIYRRIVAIAGIYYYISQPVVMFLVLVITVGAILAIMAGGVIPVKIVLIIGFVGAASIFYMLKSLLFRPQAEDPGRVVTEEEAPGLWRIVRDVATTLETRPVTEIRITNGSEMAVYERGTMRDKMNDKAERVLLVGIAGIDGLSQNAFRSVLAHEYGHFANRDTAGGDIAFQVNSAMMNLAFSMAQAGTATFYNIAFQFIRFYHFLFRRITHGASRLQEVLADRVAVYQFGAEAFREGLTHIIRRDIEFSKLADAEINAIANSGRKINNLYAMLAPAGEVGPELKESIEESLSRPTTEDDTHPSPADRFALAERVNSKEGVEPLRGEVWDLFSDRDALTQEMNQMLETSFNNVIYDLT